MLRGPLLEVQLPKLPDQELEWGIDISVPELPGDHAAQDTDEQAEAKAIQDKDAEDAGPTTAEEDSTPKPSRKIQRKGTKFVHEVKPDQRSCCIIS
mmetsp:Transcript_6377/g.10800  ORF Transcript_6377/g.10800 Transcript_6377/m.10800 type:complete len:96 (-) Transcript_6377:211-498(-)